MCVCVRIFFSLLFYLIVFHKNSAFAYVSAVCVVLNRFTCVCACVWCCYCSCWSVFVAFQWNVIPLTWSPSTSPSLSFYYSQSHSYSYYNPYMGYFCFVSSFSAYTSTESVLSIFPCSHLNTRLNSSYARLKMHWTHHLYKNELK